VIRLPIFLDIFKEHPIPSFGLSSGNRRKSFFFTNPFHFSKFGAMNSTMPKIARFLKESTFRLLRIAGILVVIYISMVFYLALTERRNAFPRAIYHKEANEAIQGKAKPLTCTLEDGSILNGFTLGNENDPVMLYFPEADEDAAQFLAQVDSLPGTNIVAFNYRGSAQNKGTPSEDTFEKDARQIAECAAQVNGKFPQTLVGRGMGAISAINQHSNNKQIILIDPIFDIADAIHQKYGFLYPKFLIRTNFKVSIDKLKKAQNNTTVLFDKKQFEERTKAEYSKLEGAKFIVRNGESLQKVLILSQKRNLF
jgi:hypothetical protein